LEFCTAVKASFIIYDYETCCDLLAEHASGLAESVEGLEKWATFREFFRSLVQESATSNSAILTQADPDLVFAFLPEKIIQASGHENLSRDVDAAVRQLVRADSPPYSFDFFEAIGERDRVVASATPEHWLEPNLFDDLILPRRVVVWVFFNAQRFLAEVLVPQLERRGFRVPPLSQEEILSGVLKVRHPEHPGLAYSIPWGEWLRDMVGGGYNIIFFMAVLALYLQKLDRAVSGGEQENE
jgi:hypothetical protein